MSESLKKKYRNSSGMDQPNYKVVWKITSTKIFFIIFTVSEMTVSEMTVSEMTVSEMTVHTRNTHHWHLKGEC